MLFLEIINVYSENYMKTHKYTVDKMQCYWLLKQVVCMPFEVGNLDDNIKMEVRKWVFVKLY
jgi:hypothetical protein